ncbi:MAG TPA: AAA family ATPase [Planctomycetaceae bacterium]|nr:AAA family ATPase [Planctomycetaceae bacterium]
MSAEDAAFLRREERLLADLLRECGVDLAGDPERGTSEGVGAGDRNLEAEWPIGGGISNAVDEARNGPLDERFRLFSAAELNSGQFETRYLIPGLLAAGQPGGIFGAFKTLKTSIAADLLISLASGTPFLGRFPVPTPGRVLFLSGESGLPALQSIVRRICQERGLSLESLDNFLLSTDLPRLDRPTDVAALKRLVKKEKPVCVVIDPAYLAMGGDKSRNLFAVGSLLHPLAELCESTGCTVLVVHHCKRSNKLGDPATLDDIAWAGFAEFAGQWLLLSRRRQFDPGTGHHELWLTAGSRAGHHGLWEVDVEEGSGLGPAPVAGGPAPSGKRRIWKTAVRTVESALIRADEQFVEASEDRRLRRRGLTVDRQGQRTLEFLAAHPEGCCARTIREALGFSGGRMSRILDRLLEKKEIDKIEWYEDRRKHVNYRRLFPMDLSAVAVEARDVTPAADQKVYDVGTGQFVDRKEIQNDRLGGAASPDLARATSGWRMIAPPPDVAPQIQQSEVAPPPDQKMQDAGTGRVGDGPVDGKESQALPASKEPASHFAASQLPASQVPPSQLKGEEPLTACAAPLPDAAPVGRDTFAEKEQSQKSVPGEDATPSTPGAETERPPQS